MDPQDIFTASLLVPAAVLGVVAWRAARRGRTSLGLGVRDGAVGEFLRGMLFSVPFLVVLAVVFPLLGLSDVVRVQGPDGVLIGIWVYFLVLFALEELAFRSLLMTGLGVVAGRGVAWVVTAVLVALPYSLNPDAGVLAVVGAVVTNALTGLARWRSGRIWWGLGQRWVFNSAALTLGFTESAFSADHPVVVQRLTGPDALTGGAFGVEGGLVGVVLLVVMTLAVRPFATGRRGPWEVRRS
ncbi:hypothetical protein GCM10011519_33290 [Marmoricola endophyticus]|uniref:CAAX prenyl protease 2/Lysostaphin resistance protein A-like domain-containing protein n=1 Tax=Marmoricola endophyticus TaxID=2040280 RepID=A0A917BTD8_9ACTN|nr:CPBP family glutamic-type intramembrane protease [Marmoricola endophyticus]GGF56727.1 hypothetical protein GCM10011519_33290 [Marmoricola endophyticus]